MQHGKLYFFCGKMGAGKTTESKALATRIKAVLISEDEWLSTLYPALINTFDDYLEYSSRMRPLIFQHVVNILTCGSDVVMDFPANTQKQRRWFRELADNAGADAELIYLRASDELCLKRIAGRRIEQPNRSAFDNKTVFEEVTKHFQAPEEHEGIAIQIREDDT